MILNLILLLVILAVIFILSRQIKKPVVNQLLIPPECKFYITKPKFEIDKSVRIARYSVYAKNKYRFFNDFPIGFKFYSEEKFRSKIRITYNVEGDDEQEIIYDTVVEFQDNVKEHIYYINDSIINTLNFEIYTDSQYGKPTIKFEILQNSMCHLTHDHNMEIIFPE